MARRPFNLDLVIDQPKSHSNKTSRCSNADFYTPNLSDFAIINASIPRMPATYWLGISYHKRIALPKLMGCGTVHRVQYVPLLPYSRLPYWQTASPVILPLFVLKQFDRMVGSVDIYETGKLDSTSTCNMDLEAFDWDLVCISSKMHNVRIWIPCEPSP